MARYSRLEVLNAMVETGLVPVFYSDDLECAKQIVAACAAGGARCIEFTNRGDFAPFVFQELARSFSRSNPQVMLGAGSIVDAPTASLYIAASANFIVGPTLNPEVARLCNRRKVSYSPGCATASEISQAEELGVEIVKIFPGGLVGGPEFVKSVMAPCPWTRIMPTGGVEPTRQSITAWFKAGVAAVGIGSNLVTKDAIKSGNYEAISSKVTEVLGLIREVRN